MKRALLVLLLLLLVGALAAFLWVRDGRERSTAVSGSDAAALVDADGAADEAPDRGRRPEPGTYHMTGEGSDHFSALGGASHTFPGEVSMVVELDPVDECAWTLHLVLVEEHVDAQHLCSDAHGALRLLGLERTTEFLGRRQTSRYECDETSAWQPAGSARRWHFSCTERRGGHVRYVARIVGSEKITIDGEQHAATRVRLDGSQDDDSTGSERTELWLLDDGLPARFTRTRRLTVRTPLGDMTTREGWDYALAARAPSKAG